MRAGQIAISEQKEPTNSGKRILPAAGGADWLVNGGTQGLGCRSQERRKRATTKVARFASHTDFRTIIRPH
jgi:hypothetical protein